MTIILSNLNRFKKFFSLEDSLVNLQLNGYLKSHCTSHMLLHYLAINDKLQCSVVRLLITKLRKVSAESVSEKNFQKGEYLAKLQART